MAWQSGKKKYRSTHNNRIYVLVTIVFLLTCLVIFRLYKLQVIEYDFYNELASSQHEMFSELKPVRGKIFIKDYSNSYDTSHSNLILTSESFLSKKSSLVDKKNTNQKDQEDFFDIESNNLYPLATNKEFVFLYAVPKKIKFPSILAKMLYIVFNQEEVVEEIEIKQEEEKEEKIKQELIFLKTLKLDKKSNEAKIAEIKSRHEILKFSPENKEKRKNELITKRMVIIEKYRKTLDKKNDPYEPIQKKVDEKKIKKLFALNLFLDKLKDGKNKTDILDLILANHIDIINKNKTEISNSFTYEEYEKDIEINKGIVLQKSLNKEIKIEGINFVMTSYRYYPAKNIGAHITGFVGYGKIKPTGNYGLEGFFNEELFGQYGKVKSDLGADHSVIIVNNREYEKPINGSHFILTINRSIQFTVCEKIKNAVKEYDADGGSVVIVNPSTGEILSMCSYPDFDPNNYKNVEDVNYFNNPIIFNAYEPGSVFKIVTIAAGLDQNKITPQTTYYDKGSIMIEGWDKPIKNSDFEERGGYGVVNMNTVLEKSLNTGTIFIQEKVGSKIFADYVKDFGFGEKTGIELETESPGDISRLLVKKIRPVEAATASFGQGITATPLQLVMAVATIANKGILMKPYIVDKIISSEGAVKIKVQPKHIRRVVSEKAALLTASMMVNVIDNGHAKRAGVDGYYVAGKTGTAQVAELKKRGYSEKTIHTFVGFAPVEDPVFTMIVKLDNPKKAFFSSMSAAPVFGDLAKFLLHYFQIPRER